MIRTHRGRSALRRLDRAGFFGFVRERQVDLFQHRLHCSFVGLWKRIKHALLGGPDNAQFDGRCTVMGTAGLIFLEQQRKWPVLDHQNVGVPLLQCAVQSSGSVDGDGVNAPRQEQLDQGEARPRVIQQDHD